MPKYHKYLGYDVEIIASLITFDKNGKGTFLSEGSSYINEHGIKVTRIDNKKPLKIYRKLNRYVGTYEAIEKAAPDIIFIHGCQFLDIYIVIEYLKKHADVKVYVDNHADFSNSATNFLSKNILHKLLWKKCANSILPFTEKFYGVLPARVDFLVDLYKLPKDKCELLVMGADDERVKSAEAPQVKEIIRKKYNINENDFLIVTGGKIDLFKKQTLLLMDAVNKIDCENVKLIVFGSVVEELKEEVNKRCSDKVQYIGWVQSDESYKYFASADLAVFPGRHSVFWEQVAGQGIPMLVKRWAGTTHIDLDGNVLFLYDDSEYEILQNLQKIIKDKDLYDKMKESAVEKGFKTFSYLNIAKRAIEVD